MPRFAGAFCFYTNLFFTFKQICCMHFNSRVSTLFLSFCFSVFFVTAQSKKYNTDVLVVGGGTGGVAAGIQAARLGIRTMIIEPTNILGGMLTAAGISCTDGNDGLPSGMWQQFREDLYLHYRTRNLSTGWVSETCFEPHVADSIFKAWAEKEKNLIVLYGCRFEKLMKKQNRVTGVVFRNQQNEILIVKAAVTIDATELGDVFAAAGAAYDLGMERVAGSGETEAIQKNDIIQDITWAAILKDYGEGFDKTIARPMGYDEKKYYCCCTDAPCNGTPYKVNAQKMLDYGKLPNNKYMLNWPAHGNDSYLNVVEEKENVRNRKYEEAKKQTLGFIYFIQTKLGFKNLGLAEDELEKGMAIIPYNREGRRLKGEIRFAINHIKNPYNYTLYRTGIAVGDYPVDHHHGQYPGKVPTIQFPKIPSFNVPLGALIPSVIDGLIVCEKGISVSNIVNGSTRLQPCVLLTGQAAGVLAALSIKNKMSIRQVPVRKVQEELLKHKCYLMPYVDVKTEDPYWEAVQKVGASGILKGIGKPEGWANKTYFYPDSTIRICEFEKGIRSLFPGSAVSEVLNRNQLTIGKAIKMITGKKNHLFKKVNSNKIHPEILLDANAWSNQLHLLDFDADRPIKRYELAVMLDYYSNVFESNPVNIQGVLLKK